MMKELKRGIKHEVERELWARAAGRCQFDGCNKLLYKSSITQEQVNIAQMAHIYSFSEDGPRGWGIFKHNVSSLNNISNLLLVCHECHRKIDQEKDGGRYQAPLLIKWKAEHERRVEIVTGVDPSKRSHVVLYGANIGEEQSLVQPEHAKWALFPDWYPAEERPISLSMSWEGKDSDLKYWQTEEENLTASFERYIIPRMSDACHFSIFGLAPMPLLIRLGTLFTDKVYAQVYQLHREPELTWVWRDSADDNPFIINRPNEVIGPPVLIISLSAKISPDRIISILGKDITIWELTIENPHKNFLKTKAQLSKYREVCIGLMNSIAEIHGIRTPLAIFPTMPVACAVELGRIRSPKAEMPWVVYDQNSKHGAFIQTLSIGGSTDVIHAESAT
jgi:hypothetical protein